MEFANKIPRNEFFQNNTTEEELLKNIIEKQIKFFENFEDEERLINYKNLYRKS